MSTKRKTKPVIIVVCLVIIIAGAVAAYFILNQPKPIKVEKDPVYRYPLTGMRITVSDKEISKIFKKNPDIKTTKEAIKKRVDILVSRRPVAVKIENSEWARPQWGLNTADIVFETMVEGGETRFHALFQSAIPRRMGPVRSARMSDAFLCPWFDSVLFYSGSNKEVDNELNTYEVPKMPRLYLGDLLYSLDDVRESLHGVYLDKTKKIYEHMAKDGFSTTSAVQSFPFMSLEKYERYLKIKKLRGTDSSIEISETSIDAIELNNIATVASAYFSGLADIEWRYDEETNKYLRYQNNELQVDGLTDEPITADNIIVMPQDYIEAKTLDPAGNPTYITLFEGENKKVKIYRDGKVFSGTYDCVRDSFPTFKNKYGKTIPLKVGRTWFEVPWDIM